MLHKHLIAKTSPVAKKENVVFYKNYRVTVLSDRLFRIEKDSKRRFCDDATQVVWFRDMTVNKFKSNASDGILKIDTGKVTLCLGDNIKKSYVLIDGKQVLLGNGGNLLGTARTLDCCDGDTVVPPKTPEIRTKLKLACGVASRSGVAVHDDSKSELLLQSGMISERPFKETDIYVFAFGNDYRAATRALYMICGSVPLVPRFAFGNWWSRYHAYSDKEYLNVLDRLSEHDIPLTVATIDMDWHWSTTLDEKKKITEQGKFGGDYGEKSGWTGYSWNTDLFPDYKKTLAEIHERNLKITLNLHPAGGVRWFEDCYPKMAKAVGIDPKTEHRIPMNFSDEKFINAYFDVIHKPYEHDGVDFWWIDWQQGTRTEFAGYDPLWALNHYHTLDSGKEHLPLLLSRYCGIGAHRYPLGFSGDTYVTWKSLSYIPYFTATATNAGYTWWSHDIGGHMFGLKDNELYTRYVQFGAFSPINRLHSTCDFTATKEPFVYANGAGFIASEFLRFRHSLIPFLYSAAYETNKNGTALIEPMYYEYPEKEEAYTCKGQYLFGGQMIVAPVTSKGDKEKLALTKVWLPEGHYTDIFTGDEYDGGRTVETLRWLDSIPVLAKDGAIIPLDARKHTNSIENPDKMRILVFSGNGEYTLHEDKSGVWADTVFTSEKVGDTETVTVRIGDNPNVIPERTLIFEMRNIRGGAVKTYRNGKEIKPSLHDDAFLSVTIENCKPGEKYKISVKHDRDRVKFRNERFLYSLQRIEGENRWNNFFYRKLSALSDDECREYISANERLTKNQKKRLLESLY